MPPVQDQLYLTIHDALSNLSLGAAPRGKSHILPKQSIWGPNDFQFPSYILIFYNFNLLWNLN